MLNEDEKQLKDAFHLVIKKLEHGNLLEALKLVTKNPALLTFTDEYGRGLLHLSTQYDSHGLFCRGLLAVSKVDPVDKYRQTPLHFAVHYNNIPVALVLLQGGADINAMTTRGITPLHLAMTRATHSMVSLLLNAKAKLEVQVGKGYTPYDLAARTKPENLTRARELRENMATYRSALRLRGSR